MPYFDFIYFCKVAERVAAERAEACGNGKSTGYQIRLQRYEGLPGHCLCVHYLGKKMWKRVLGTHDCFHSGTSFKRNSSEQLV